MHLCVSYVRDSNLDGGGDDSIAFYVTQDLHLLDT